MQALDELLREFATKADARWWLGRRPAVSGDQLASVVAGKIGLPTATTNPFIEGHMVRLSRSDAAHVLAVAGTTSLAYGEPSPAKHAVDSAALALDDLAIDAVFLSNGRWRSNAPIEWSPATSATFDCGLIGYDRENAFIFWVAEED